MSSNDNSPMNENSMILSIRLIRSFEHRNIRHITLRSIDSSGQMTGKELKQRILTMLPNEKLPPPFKTFAFDTLKIEHYPHQAKSNDVVIRRDSDEQLIIEDAKCLCDYNIIDGTEIAFFKRSDYELYKQNPDLVMD
ncbi:unnamed protein product [Rotaria sordida]|uniref:Uncharacterized protein n=1 Tax=Rotaria sordida TaxID=392033 RepID=A0A814YAZ9_9BILA|nr:unnamed protein product [Rotaria sordida]CAF1226612.1 unnamed protein product [Rotaria sordida]CAF1297018.1 unnamed protein product [Rotaria sordida]CAF1311698.1 unnamed protein product [Rotaria sordida]CAF1312771.1 unnamed protein product [Rotaria sordida]